MTGPLHPLGQVSVWIVGIRGQTSLNAAGLLLLQQAVVGVIGILHGIADRARDGHLRPVAPAVIGIVHRQAAGFALLRQAAQAVVGVSRDMIFVVCFAALVSAGVIAIGIGRDDAVAAGYLLCVTPSPSPLGTIVKYAITQRLVLFVLP